MINIKQGDRILFEGDSITDTFRDRADFHSLSGYSKIVNDIINAANSSLKAECFNRGISGDTSAALLARIEKDLEDVRPTIFSVLIGINDTWRRFSAKKITTAVEYGKNVSLILDAALKYTDRIIIIEPFLLKVQFGKRKFRPDLAEKINMIKDIAQKYKAEYISMDSIFAEACKKIKPKVLSYDGVHLTDKGYDFLAKEWLKHIKTD